MKNISRHLYWILLLILPSSTFFSYYPVISPGSNSSMNFELSLPLIFLVLFDLVAFLNLFLIKRRPSLTADLKTPSVRLSDRRFFLFSLFPLYATISIFWSANPLRAILTAGILWLLFFAVFAILYISPLLSPPAKIRRYFLVSFFSTTVFVCLFCFFQSILDIAGLPREVTLLCPGCTYRSFGFPHPSGFAIEPQFMGNLLLAPALLALYLLVFRAKGNRKEYHQNREQTARREPQVTTRKSGATLRQQASRTRLEKSPDSFLMMLGFLFSATLFFTLSRGAIYAYLIALLVMFIFSLVRKCFRPSLIIIPALSFAAALVLQGTFAALGPTSETFSSAIAKSVHQLSLGVVDFRGSVSPVSSQEALEGPSDSDPESYKALPESSLEPPENAPETPYFDGYVAESTNVRLNLNIAALDTWLASNPLFGVGLGGAGTALYLNSPLTGITSPKEIVQNEPLSLLLELGLTGIILVVFSLLIAFAPQLFPRRFLDGRAAQGSGRADPSPLWRSPALPLLLGLVLAYVVTLQFFSGLPNALHIYLLPPLLYFFLC